MSRRFAAQRPFPPGSFMPGMRLGSQLEVAAKGIHLTVRHQERMRGETDFTCDQLPEAFLKAGSMSPFAFAAAEFEKTHPGTEIDRTRWLMHSLPSDPGTIHFWVLPLKREP